MLDEVLAELPCRHGRRRRLSEVLKDEELLRGALLHERVQFLCPPGVGRAASRLGRLVRGLDRRRGIRVPMLFGLWWCRTKQPHHVKHTCLRHRDVDEIAGCWLDGHSDYRA